MKKSILRLLLLGVLCFALAASASAAVIRGRIIHSSGYPAVGIAVRVVSQRLGPSGFTYSGRDGMFYLQGIPAGPYVIEIWISNQNVLRYNIGVGEPVTDLPVVTVQ
jgi:Carboxypeptidase regulatory-like domain